MPRRRPFTNTTPESSESSTSSMPRQPRRNPVERPVPLSSNDELNVAAGMTMAPEEPINITDRDRSRSSVEWLNHHPLNTLHSNELEEIVASPLSTRHDVEVAQAMLGIRHQTLRNRQRGLESRSDRELELIANDPVIPSDEREYASYLLHQRNRLFSDPPLRTARTTRNVNDAWTIPPPRRSVRLSPDEEDNIDRGEYDDEDINSGLRSKPVEFRFNSQKVLLHLVGGSAGIKLRVMTNRHTYDRNLIHLLYNRRSAGRYEFSFFRTSINRHIALGVKLAARINNGDYVIAEVADEPKIEQPKIAD